MSDDFTEVTYKSWFERIMDSIKGVLVGLTLITIAIGWIAYRPVLGISLIVGAVVIFGLMFFIGGKRKKASAAR